MIIFILYYRFQFPFHLQLLKADGTLGTTTNSFTIAQGEGVILITGMGGGSSTITIGAGSQSISIGAGPQTLSW